MKNVLKNTLILLLTVLLTSNVVSCNAKETETTSALEDDAVSLETEQDTET